MLLAGCVCGGQVGFLIFGEVYLLPFAVDDAVADLRGSFAFVGLFVGVEGLAHADVTAGAVAAGEAIEQALVALTAIAMAVAGLLVKNFFDAAGDGIGVEHFEIGEERRLHGGRQDVFGSFGVEGGDGVVRLRRLGVRVLR